MTEVLVGALGAKLVVVGSDFHFGHNRHGNVELLEKMGEKLGFEVVGVSLEARPRRGSGVLDEDPRAPREPAVSPRRASFSAVTTSCGARSSVVIREEVPSSGSPTANVAVPARDGDSRARVSTPAGTSTRTAAVTRRPSRSGTARHSTPKAARPCSRPTSSTSPATCTASGPR